MSKLTIGLAHEWNTQAKDKAQVVLPYALQRSGITAELTLPAAAFANYAGLDPVERFDFLHEKAHTARVCEIALKIAGTSLGALRAALDTPEARQAARLKVGL